MSRARANQGHPLKFVWLGIDFASTSLPFFFQPIDGDEWRRRPTSQYRTNRNRGRRFNFSIQAEREVIHFSFILLDWRFFSAIPIVEVVFTSAPGLIYYYLSGTMREALPFLFAFNLGATPYLAIAIAAVSLANVIFDSFGHMNGHFLLCDVDMENKNRYLMLMHIHSAIAVGDAILVAPFCAIISLSLGYNPILLQYDWSRSIHYECGIKNKSNKEKIMNPQSNQVLH